MARKQNKKRKEQTKLSKVLSSSNKREKVITDFFNKLSGNEIRLAIPHLLGHRHFKESLTVTSRDFSSIYYRATPSIELSKSIHWCLGIIEANKELIESFIKIEEETLDFLLNNNIECALRKLDTLDEECGVSIWSLGIRGTILSVDSRLEEKRGLIVDVNAKSKDNRFLKTTASLLVNRHEDHSTLPAFNNFSEQKIRRGFSGDLLHFLMYKIVPLNYTFHYDFSSILNFEKNTHVIDIYHAVVDLIKFSLTTANKRHYRGESEVAIGSLYRLFNTEKLRCLANGFGIETDFECSDQDIRVLDWYTAGEYRAVCDFFMVHYDKALKFSLFEIWVKSACRTKIYPKGFLGSLMISLSSIIMRDDKYEESLSEIYLLCHSFQGFSWFRDLHLFITKEARFISKEISKNLLKASLIMSELNSPQRAKALPKGIEKTYIQSLIAQHPNSLSIELFFSKINGDDILDMGCMSSGIDVLRLKKYKALEFINHGHFDEAVSLLLELSVCSDEIIRGDALKLLVSAYITINDIESALSAYVQIVMENKAFLRAFDSKVLCDNAVPLIDDSDDIAIPITLSLHSLNLDSEFDAALKFSFEMFLKNNNCESPLELFDVENNFNLKELYYFLEYVCTPEVMKLYFYFDTPNEIEECRIEICKRLIERNHSQESMIFEVKERTKRQVILKAAKQVDNSRIYSDVSGIFNSTSFRHLYDSYVALRVKDYSNTDDEKELGKIINKMQGHKSNDGQDALERSLHIIHVQNIILNEKNATFMRLMKLVRDEFAFGVKGLNSHLSTRIRHGHLPNSLRQCFAEQNLVSPKTNATGGFKKNDFWVGNFSYLNDSKKLQLDKEFADFSTKLLDITNEVNDKWLQIVIYDQDIAGLGEDKLDRTALLNYSTTFVENMFVQKSLSLSSDYNDFIKVISAWLWRRTEDILQIIRSQVDTNLKDRLISLLDTLEKNIFNIVGDSQALPIFNASVAASRVKIRTTIETISGWFNRAKGLSIPYYDSDVAISIAEWSAGVNVEHIDDTNMQLQGWTLTYIIDALYVLLDNCLTKSNLDKNELLINSTWLLTDVGLEISIINNCHIIDCVDAKNSELDYYRKSYGVEDISIKASQGEGNSGFFKIWKSLSKDLELNHTIEFGYVSGSAFKVSITIFHEELKKVVYSEDFIN